MITNLIREYVKGECYNIHNNLKPAFFEQHILVVRDFALRIAELLGANREIVEISTYLHDISAIQDFSTLSEHTLISSDIAEKILKNYSYDVNKIIAVKQCILTHSAPIQMGKGSLEEICLSNADAISQIINPKYWLFFAFNIRKMSFEQGVEWYAQKIDANWEGLIDQAKDMINEEQIYLKTLFGQSK